MKNLIQHIHVGLLLYQHVPTLQSLKFDIHCKPTGLNPEFTEKSKRLLSYPVGLCIVLPDVSSKNVRDDFIYIFAVIFLFVPGFVPIGCP